MEPLPWVEREGERKMSLSDHPGDKSSDSGTWKPLYNGKSDKPADQESREQHGPDTGGFRNLFEEVTTADEAYFLPLYNIKEDTVAQSIAWKIKPADPEEIKKRAYGDGFAKGETNGYQAGIKKAASDVQNIGNLLSEIEGLWQKLVETYDTQIIQLNKKGC